MPLDPDGGVWAALNPYPRARSSRGRGIPTNSAEPLVAMLPNVRNWSGAVETAGTNRISQVASPRFSGPVVLDTLHYAYLSPGRTTPLAEYFIYANASPYTAAINSTDLSRRIGTPVFERSRGGTNEDSQNRQDGMVVPDLASGQSVDIKLGKLLTTGDVFLVLGVISTSASAHSFYFNLRVLENVDMETVGMILAG